MRVLVIIPTYNEAENIAQLIPQILQFGEYIDVLVVDDNSPDGTADVVRNLQNEYPGRIQLIVRPKKLGLGSAYITGFKFALERGYDYVFEMDADLSHNPSEIPKMLELAKDSYDFVIGSRYSHGVSVVNWPMRRILLSFCANLYARKVTGVPVSDLTSGFKCISRKVLEGVNLDKIRSEGYAFQIEMSAKAFYKGFKVSEHPIIFVERRSGVSKMSKKIVIEAFFRVLQLGALRAFNRIKSFFKAKGDGK